MATLIGTSKRLKSFVARMFESKWTYNDGYTVRVHKKTGKIEHLWMDGYGSYWMDEPMFGD